MKLAVTVLASILLACSVTTVSSVNPSAATSAETSSLTAQPSATTNSVFEDWTVFNAEITNSVDLSRLSEDDARLIKKHLKLNEKCKKTKKARGLAESAKLDQERLVSRLDEKYQRLLNKFQGENGSKYGERLLKAKLELEKEQEILVEIEKKCQSLGSDIFGFNLELNITRGKLARRLFGDNLDIESLYLYMEFLKSDLSFVESIYNSLILVLSQQPGSEQASTSETQSSSQYHETPTA
ncbi:hypothetical protein BATDEDRAFT_92830 [Batrachochytrium dendrobatidis JAM81]|uniref:Uncharacterized protein n=2 Tax=Batrachochytrium dendrobatidis TaxID=109871 RepID=F4PET1_BATDJ|nr:uncharacterized protein BATDEDRAFT_92830 [Batrachochytrium dendrobatidis JAM81]EGF76341.1 hypothetical protein BATDEDRAFT_92830 [Batrachochytrium dendrobatidis JAM81]OAJ42972.1 hypothetical protein BDEG_26358 [Batrachochytrium dendrobatidis JEL423]|eukprot:XP_006683124.1 hypothetical protein BATDEDRAFT_92830 [Batrachochytrium dendrobatidis JAM81]